MRLQKISIFYLVAFFALLSSIGNIWSGENSLDLYDSHARFYDSMIGRTTSQDPLAEKYYHLSPYLWCAANPIKFGDKNGKQPVKYIDENGIKRIDWSIVVRFTILYHKTKGYYVEQKNKVSETMICRYIYHPHLDSRIERYCFPCLSLFPFQWALILGALFINTFTNKMPLKCITVIIILLSSVAVFFMDIVGSLFFNQNVWLLHLYLFSILNMLVSVKILIDMLTFCH